MRKKKKDHCLHSAWIESHCTCRMHMGTSGVKFWSRYSNSLLYCFNMHKWRNSYANLKIVSIPAFMTFKNISCAGVFYRRLNSNIFFQFFFESQLLLTDYPWTKTTEVIKSFYTFQRNEKFSLVVCLKVSSPMVEWPIWGQWLTRSADNIFIYILHHSSPSGKIIDRSKDKFSYSLCHRT